MKPPKKIVPKPAPVLSSTDAQAWQQSVAAVRPLPNRKAAPPLPRVKPIVLAGDFVPPTRAGASGKPQPARMGATLDATWDRKTRDGDVAPDLVIDLHGKSVSVAFDALRKGIERAVTRRARIVLVITGKGLPPNETWPEPDPKRGAIRMQFANWIEQPEIAAHVASVRPAHTRHGGAGAWYVILKRVRAAGQ
jgi:DNA-nicking Smr family endonuclease